MNSIKANSDSDRFKEWESIGSEVTFEVLLSLSMPPHESRDFHRPRASKRCVGSPPLDQKEKDICHEHRKGRV